MYPMWLISETDMKPFKLSVTYIADATNVGFQAEVLWVNIQCPALLLVVIVHYFDTQISPVIETCRKLLELFMHPKF